MLDVEPVSPRLRIVEEEPGAAPSPRILARIDEIWQARREEHGALFDGRLFTVTRRGRDRLAGHFVDYLWFVAQCVYADLFDELRLRPLAVSGLLGAADGIVFGRRGADVATDAGMWELVPSGGIDEVRDANGAVSIEGQFLAELEEELGVPRLLVSSVAPFALVEDTQTHVCDVAFEARLACGRDALMAYFESRRNTEYGELMLVGRDALSDFLAARRGGVVAVSIAVLETKGLIDGAAVRA